MRKVTIFLSIILLVHLSEISAQRSSDNDSRQSSRTNNSNKKSPFSPSEIKEFCEKAGASKKDCINALKEAGGNMEKALDILHKTNKTATDRNKTNTSTKSARNNRVNNAVADCSCSDCKEDYCFGDGGCGSSNPNFVEDGDADKYCSWLEDTTMCWNPGCSDDGGGLKIMYNTDIPIGGFKFRFPGTDIKGASGGAASDNGFTVSTRNDKVKGQSLTRATIPAGSGVLVVLDMSADDVCIGNFIIFDSSGNPLNATVENCTTINIVGGN